LIVNKKNLKLLMGGLSAALFISTCDEILDVSPPDVSFVYPKNDQTVSSSFTIELDVSDNKEVDEVKLYYDYEDDWYEEELLHTISEAPWSTNISFSLSSSRSYTFRAVAYDKVGNFSEASVSSVTVIPGGGGGGGSGSSITVTSPNGGESWAPGSTQNITWTSSSAGSYVIIHLYKNGSYNSSIAGATANDGSYSWSIPSSQTESDYYTVKITDYYDSSVYDYSDGYFSIESGGSSSSITVTSPNGGESWAAGSTQNITWNSSGSGSVTIDLYHTVDNASYTGYVDEQLSTISSYTSNDGSYSWSISSSLAAASNYKIRVADYNNSSVYDFSDGNFSIASASSGSSITVTSPNGGESWAPGSTQNITWSSSSAGSYVIIHLYKNGSYNSSIAGATANDGSYSWSIPSSQTESDYYTVKITDYYDSSVYDYSNGYFSIVETSCATPTGLYTSNISSDQATLNWNSVSSANSYNLRARATGQSSWNEGNFTGTSINFTGLTGGTQYEWQVQAVCSGSNTSSWSSTEYFTTASGSSTGEDCDDAYYCSECNNCESNCCPNYCSGNYYYYNRSCSNGFCVGSTSDYCPNGCDENGCL
jgi:hypothetical protein